MSGIVHLIFLEHSCLKVTETVAKGGLQCTPCIAPFHGAHCSRPLLDTGWNLLSHVKLLTQGIAKKQNRRIFLLC